jgi:hypothetical protein
MRISKEKDLGYLTELGQNEELNRKAHKNSFFLNLIQRFGFKIKDFKHFQTKFELKPN